jgi:hypothetical protein
MLDLYIFYETFNGLNKVLLTFVSIAKAIDGNFVIVSKNIFVCALILSIAGLIFIILLATPIGEFKQGEKLDAKQTLDENNKNRGTKLVLAHCTHVVDSGVFRVNKQFV